MNGADEHAEPNTVLGIGDILGILWHRRLWIAVPFVVGLIGAVIAAFVMQPVYQSSSTLLIESQQIPTSLVASPFSSYADERIAKIRQQILSRSTLLRLITQDNLYPRARREVSIDTVLAEMRRAIDVNLVNASTGQGHGADATIAFNLAYRYFEPVLAQKVARQLTDIFITEDKRLRTEQATGAAAFLQTRADELRDRLVELENKRRAIQAHYAGAMPDQVALSTQSTATLRGDLARIDVEVQSLLQQNTMLAARSEDVVPAPETPARAEVRRAQLALSHLSAIYSERHPDIIAAREALNLARHAAAAEPNMASPVNIVAREIEAGRGRISALGERRAHMLASIAANDRLVATSPQAAYELNNLERDRDNLKQQYTEIREKQLEAQVAANLQREDKGERFSVVDPPNLPFEPARPKRLQLVLLGGAGGLALGLALILAWEIYTGCIHGEGVIARLTGEVPMATIPVLRSGPLPSLLTTFDRILMMWRRRVTT